MAYTLPPLPYPTNALEPSIDATTMEIHHGRHHKAYVDNVNKALDGQTAAGAEERGGRAHRADERAPIGMRRSCNMARSSAGGRPSVVR